MFLALPCASQEDFTFIQISDSHFEPVKRVKEGSRRFRGKETFDWLREILGGNHDFEKERGIPVPGFIVHTGDLSEFGFAYQTPGFTKKVLDGLGLEWFFVPGNHDNTWVPMKRFLQRRKRGWNRSFRRHGFGFILVNSAPLCEPLPVIGAGTRKWVEGELRRYDPRPVFIFMHHPFPGSELEKTNEYKLFISLVDDWNVALILCGHGHVAFHGRLERGIDWVMGGATFKKGKTDWRGCNYVSVKKGVLRVMYRFFDAGKKPLLLLKKKLRFKRKKAKLTPLMHTVPK